MRKDEAPVVLELAPLPREQIGPFLLLGLDKDADKEQIEAHWAQRVIWARKGQVDVALQEVHWAREVINDPDKRVRADAASLNPDTTDRVLRQLGRRFGAGGDATGPAWQPLDVEKPLADYTPPTPVPDPDEVRAALIVPEVPCEVPAVAGLLEAWVREPLDPWDLNLPPAPSEESP
jgi:hypothetical protein